MERRREITDLSALLDGELKGARVEELFARINEDETLREEFELQREVKTALGQLPVAEAPDFMATRVLGEIAARRNRRANVSWRTVAASLGGFSFCLLVVVGMMIFNNQGPAPADHGGAYLARDMEAGARPVMPLDAEFSTWSTPVIPASADQGAQDYLEFVSDQHDYIRRLNSSGSLNRDLSGVILLLENGETIYLSPEDIE